jgi:hypothetical protein
MIINPYAFNTCPYATDGAITQIGTYSTTTAWSPAYGLYNYSLNASIYSLGVTGLQITGIQIQVTGYTTLYSYTNQEIWMGQISNATFPTSSPQVNFSDLTFTVPLKQVKNSFTYSPTNNVWQTINFDTPYCYDGSGYTLLVWKNYDGSWTSGYGQGQSANVVSKGMYAVSDPSFPTGTGTRTNYPMLIKIIT